MAISRRGRNLSDVRHAIAAVAALGLVVCGCGSMAQRRPSSATPPAVPVARDRCPQNDQGRSVLLGRSAGEVLVPGRPTSALLCRYWGGAAGLADTGDGHPSHSLAEALQIVRPDVTSYLAEGLNSLSPISPRANCDEVVGDRSDLIVFHYRGTQEARVRISSVGCVPVTNGRVVREGLGHLGGGVHWPDEGLL
jgi:hypothetical protein